MSKIVFYDTETTGTGTRLNEDGKEYKVEEQIIQIAAAAFSTGPTWQKLDAFERKLIFNVEQADPEALKINHYDPEVWAREAVPPAVAAADFAKFVDRYRSVHRVGKDSGKSYQVTRMAGHNVLGFDNEWVEHWLRSSGHLFKGGKWFSGDIWGALDTRSSACEWELVTGDHTPNGSRRLEDLAAHFGIKYAAHDALADVMANARVLKTMLDRMQAARQNSEG